MPVAVNCCVVPLAMLVAAGVTVMPVSTAAVTVSVVDPLMLVCESVAVIVVAPVVTEVANPWLPCVFEIVATPLCEELHVTDAVRSCVELSL